MGGRAIVVVPVRFRLRFRTYRTSGSIWEATVAACMGEATVMSCGKPETLYVRLQGCTARNLLREGVILARGQVPDVYVLLIQLYKKTIGNDGTL